MTENAAMSTSVVISNEKPIEQSSAGTLVVATPQGRPDMLVTVVTPLVAILVRAAKAYLQTLVGLLGAAGFGMASNALPPGDFRHTFIVCAGLSVASGVMSLLTNTLLLLTALGDKFPTLKT